MMTSEQIADRVDLRDDEVRPAQRRRAGAQQLDEEGRVVAEDAQDLERAPAEPEQADHGRLMRRASQPRNPRPAAAPDSGTGPARRARRG